MSILHVPDIDREGASYRSMEPIATISRSALLHNLQTIRKLVPAARVLAVVKGEAYGHGLLPISRLLADHVDALGVSRLSEALDLRSAGLKAIQILLLGGVYTAADLRIASEAGLTLAVHHPEQLDLLYRTPLPEPISVWLKVDVGLNRLGFSLGSELYMAFDKLQASSSVDSNVTLFGHLGTHEDPTSEAVLRQIAAFRKPLPHLPRSLFASGGILSAPEESFHWVRPGIIQYGLSPFETVPEQLLTQFRPVMELKAPVVSVKPIAAGAPCGYGGTWAPESKTHLGIVALGYADGITRELAPGTPLLVNGRCYPLVARVSMDLLCIDLGAHPEVTAGDWAILWNRESLRADYLAQRLQRSVYAIVSQLTARVQRVVIP